jgi:hypothetical protein
MTRKSDFDITTFDFAPKDTSRIVQGLFDNADLNVNTPKIEQRWEEIELIYDSLARGLLDSSVEINAAIGQIRVLSKADNKELAAIINTGVRDITEFANALAAIHDRHKHLSGVIKDENDHMLMFTVFNEYMILTEKFRAVTFPLVLTLTEELATLLSESKKIEQNEVPGESTAAPEDQPPAQGNE